jgi:hypothetical protein
MVRAPVGKNTSDGMPGVSVRHDDAGNTAIGREAILVGASGQLNALSPKFTKATNGESSVVTNRDCRDHGKFLD